MYKYGLALWLMWGCIGAWAQEEAVQLDELPILREHCGTTEADAQLRLQYPEWETRDEFENWLQEAMGVQDAWEAQRGDPILTIPVVVHVVHNGFAVGVSGNISAAQINSQIDVLNEDFRRMMGTAGFNSDSVGADSEIEFCLAYRAPDGTQIPERGINRINRNFESFIAPPYTDTYVNNTIKPATIWDPNQYFNIWVTPIDDDILGYAQFPASSGLQGVFPNGNGQTDGIVIQPQNFGRIGNVSAPYNLGRTATHEVGHFLGLIHISGDGVCGTDDFCTDTPESDEQNYGCAVNHVSCTTVDMVRNYMDYSNDACFNIFTQCQKTRMRTVMVNSPRRKELPTSTACEVPTAAPVAAYAVDSSLSCNGIYQFSDASAPFATSWVWTFSTGEVFTVRDPELIFDSVGTYTFTLITNNALGTSAPISGSITIGFSGELDIDAGPNQTIQPGGFTILNGTGASSYVWIPTAGLSNPNIANPIAQPLVTTIYSVVGTDVNGCTGENAMILYVEGTVGLEGQLGEGGTVNPVFPNPASTAITFSAELEVRGELAIRLLDVNGKYVQNVYKQKAQSGLFEYTWQRRASLGSGIYFAEWELNGRKFVQKVLFTE